jgi:carbonic anhydrase
MAPKECKKPGCHEQHVNKHEAESLVLSCIDYRLVDATVTELERGYNAPFDYTTLAGASLYVNRPERTEWRNTYLQTVLLARDLHNIKGIVCVQHEECGAFVGVYPYLIDPKTGKIPLNVEIEYAAANMKALRDLMREIHPDLYFRGYFLSLNGTLKLMVKGKPVVAHGPALKRVEEI